MATSEDSAGGFGEYLTNEYEILRRVFSFLSAIDLRSCAEVCSAWKETSLVTLKHRRGVQCLTITDKNTKPFIVSEAALTLSFNTLPRQSVEDDFGSALSKESVQIIARYGIIGVIHDSKPLARRQRVELPLTPIAFLQSIARFSDFEGAILRVLTIGFQKKTSSEVEALINLPEDVQIQAVILFVCDDDADENVSTLLNCLRRRKKEFALGGCRLDSDDTSDDLAIKCVIFAGNNVEAGSVVLDNQCRTAKDINSKVEKLSKSVIQVKNSVMLTFRCCDRIKVRRHYNYTPKENVETWETNAVKTYFPNVSAVGCYGVGEFGLEYPSAATAKKPRLASAGSLGIEYAFSTILVYVGFKK